MNQAITLSTLSFICERQALLGKTDQQVAEALPDTSLKVFSTIKSGRTKLPFDRVPALAAALQVTTGELLTVVLTDYDPDLLELLRETWTLEKLTKTELQLVETARTLSRGHEFTPVILDGKTFWPW